MEVKWDHFDWNFFILNCSYLSMAIDKFELMAAMPRDMQYDVLFTLIPSYDVQWDIEYICEQAG